MSGYRYVDKRGTGSRRPPPKCGRHGGISVPQPNQRKHPSAVRPDARLSAKRIPLERFVRAVLAAQHATLARWRAEGGHYFHEPETGAPPPAACRQDVEELLYLPWKVAIAKFRRARRQGLVDGCACGCRGDWEVTWQGRMWLYVIDSWQARAARELARGDELAGRALAIRAEERVALEMLDPKAFLPGMTIS